MERAVPRRESLGGLSAQLNRAAALTIRRDGRRVPAYYTSVAAELAVCVKSAGIALRPELDTLDLVGHPAWLDGLLARELGRQAPTLGRAECVAEAWYARVEPGATLVVGTPGAIARWRRLTHQATMAGALTAASTPGPRAVVSLIGPRVDTLLAASGLPTAVPRARVRACTFGGGSTVLLREDVQRVLLVLEADKADDAWGELCEAGRGLGVTAVGADAIARLDASRPR